MVHHVHMHDHEETPAPSFVRSFTITGGRTAPRVDLPLEARLTVAAEGRRRRWPVGPQGDVIGVADGRSVAEVSALLKLPIGVTRVILGDLVAEGHVTVERTLHADSGVAERRELLERTLRGLRAS